MMHKKLIYLILGFFFITSCGTFDSVKRGITGEKKVSTDEFFIKKKDPLILPPDYESLPDPDESIVAIDEMSAIEKTLGSAIEDEDNTSGSSSAENSILRKIQSK